MDFAERPTKVRMTVLHAVAKPVAGRRRCGMKVTLDGGTAEFLEPGLIERAGDR